MITVFPVRIELTRSWTLTVKNTDEDKSGQD